MNLTELPVLFLDLQTTGSSPLNSHILEIAWATTDESSLQSNMPRTLQNSSESHLVKLPEGETVPRRIEMITGISNADLVGALILPTVLGKLHDALPDLKLVVIHFAQFERPFLLDAYVKCGQEMPFKILCTHLIAKRLMPNLPSRGLKGLAGYFGFNAGELKRGTSHVKATSCIWRALTLALAREGLHTLEELEAWLADKPKKITKKYEYPLAKEKRLALPDQPGVYRMVSQWGEVLYVGKATSLHSRVNSYFRGQKNRDPRKLEMLTQTWDLQVTPCGSPLESAILETDEIKRLNPRYNISLKKGLRKLVFFNREFTSFLATQDNVHTIGPFSSLQVLESMMKLGASLTENVFDETLFFEPVDPELLRQGFAVFCERHDFNPYSFSSMRSVIAVGLWWQRQRDMVEDESMLLEEIEEELNENPEVDVSPEDIANRFERHFLRAGQAYARAQRLTRLMNADIDFQLANSDIRYHLVVRRGHVQSADGNLQNAVLGKAHPWAEHSVETYDRMAVLNSELEKINSQNGKVHINFQ